MQKSRADLYLAAILGGFDAVDTWWITPNKLFDNQIPENMWATDKKELIITYIVKTINTSFRGT